MRGSTSDGIIWRPWNVQPLEAVDRGSETQPQVVENYGRQILTSEIGSRAARVNDPFCSWLYPWLALIRWLGCPITLSVSDIRNTSTWSRVHLLTSVYIVCMYSGCQEEEWNPVPEASGMKILSRLITFERRKKVRFLFTVFSKSILSNS